MTDPLSSSATTREGRIVTFYSYKGGTGRSMALANAAWILASQGKKVLVVDWDLEAPGLHRYFHPFLEDKELSESVGLIDYFYEVVGAARAASSADAAAAAVGETDAPWWQAWTSWLRYTYPLNMGALEGSTTRGSIDLVPAGRQTSDYGDRVSSFDWKSFYERLGGGVLLEAIKRRLRERYDYVLIDSRTGINDASGICTVQMPDDLVVCFTLNRQSMVGAAAAARSAASQRMTQVGTNGLRVWPVPMRIELNERDRLEAARTSCRAIFWAHLGPLLKDRNERAAYWGQVEVLYQPYFAYEEVLAVFSERRHQTSSMLSSLEYLVGCLTDDTVTELGHIDSQARMDIMRSYVPAADADSVPAQPSLVFLSYPKESREIARAIAEHLTNIGVDTWIDERSILPGSSFAEAIAEGLAASELMLCLVPPQGLDGFGFSELKAFKAQKKIVIPVLIEGAEEERLPNSLRGVQAIRLSKDAQPHEYASLAESVSMVLERRAKRKPRIDADDPQKGLWGGSPTANGRVFDATISPLSGPYYEILLSVSSNREPLTGAVVFHLHPSFEPAVRPVEVSDGVASLRLVCWGAFTVGATTDAGKVRLELDLAQLSAAPASFRAR